MKPRGGTTAELGSYIPQAREIVVDTDLNAIKVGDGTTPGGHLLSVNTNLINTVTMLTAATAIAGQVGATAILINDYTDTSVMPNVVYRRGLYQIVSVSNVNTWTALTTFNTIPSFETLALANAAIATISEGTPVYITAGTAENGLYYRDGAGLARVTGLTFGNDVTRPIRSITGARYDDATGALTIDIAAVQRDQVRQETYGHFTSDDSTTPMYAIGNNSVTPTLDNQLLVATYVGTIVNSLMVGQSVRWEIWSGAGFTGNLIQSFTATVSAIGAVAGTGTQSTASVTLRTQLATLPTFATNHFRLNIVTPGSHSTVILTHNATTSELELENVDAAEYPDTATSVANTPISWTSAITPWQGPLGTEVRFYQANQLVTYQGLLYRYISSRAGSLSNNLNRPGLTTAAGNWEQVNTDNLDAHNGALYSPAIQTVSSPVTNGIYLPTWSGTATRLDLNQALPIARGVWKASQRYFFALDGDGQGGNSEIGVIFDEADTALSTSNISTYVTQRPLSSSISSFLTDGSLRSGIAPSVITYNRTDAHRAGSSFLVHQACYIKLTYNIHRSVRFTNASFSSANTNNSDANITLEPYYSWIDYISATPSRTTRIAANNTVAQLAPGVNNVSTTTGTVGGAGTRHNYNHNTSQDQWRMLANNANGVDTFYRDHGQHVNLTKTTIIRASANDIFTLNTNTQNQPVRFGGSSADNRHDGSIHPYWGVHTSDSNIAGDNFEPFYIEFEILNRL